MIKEYVTGVVLGTVICFAWAWDRDIQAKIDWTVAFMSTRSNHTFLDYETGEEKEVHINDAWGNEISYDVQVSGDLVIAVVLTSNGLDGIKDTSDDIVCWNMDNDQTEIISEWIGSWRKKHPRWGK